MQLMKFAKSQACQTQALMHPSQTPAPPAYSYYSPKNILKTLNSTEIPNSGRPCCGLVILLGEHQQMPSHCPRPSPSDLCFPVSATYSNIFVKSPGTVRNSLRSLKATVAKAHGYLSASVTCSFLVPRVHPPGPSYSATLSSSLVSCYLLFLLNTSALCCLKKVKFAPSLVFKCIQQIALIKRS